MAVVFLVALFFFKNKTTFKNPLMPAQSDPEKGLIYDKETLENLVNKDTDNDGILDWEEGLWGTDPTKKETTPGTPDRVAIEKLKAEQRNADQEGSLPKKEIGAKTGNLTQTDKFSRELFATVAAASQNGTMDQASIEALSAALAERIQNPVPQKVFLISDLKISAVDNKTAAVNYGNALINIQKIYTVNYTVLDVLQEFMVDEDTVNVGTLKKLDPIIAQTKKIIETALKTSVPYSLANLHLNVINSLERLVENLNDIKLYDSDAIVAFGAISQYNQNAAQLESDMNSLQNAIVQKSL